MKILELKCYKKLIVPITVNVCMQVHKIFSYSDVQNNPQSHRQLTKLRNMIVNIKTKVLIKFGTSEMMYEEYRA